MINQYILILIWVGVMALIAHQLRLKKMVMVSGKWEARFPWLLAFITFFPIIWMAANRGMIGDTPVYADAFASMPESFSLIPEYMKDISKDPGFYCFAAIIKTIIGNNKVLYFFILAAIQGVILVSVYRKYSEDFFMSVFLFLASTDYISWMFNGVRQFMAAVFIFAAAGLMIRRKLVPAILVILFASLFHQSALIMIPIVIVVQGRAWNARTLVFLALTVLAILYVDRFTTLLDDALAYTQYENVVSEYTAWHDDGTNPLRVAVYSVPALISFFGREQIKYENDPLINLCTNMSIATAGLYLISMVTSGIFLGRLPIYCSLFNYILLPWEIRHLFTRQSGRLIYVVMIFSYLFLYYYQMHNIFGIL